MLPARLIRALGQSRIPCKGSEAMSLDSIIKEAKSSISLSGVSSPELKLWARRLVCILGPSGVGKHSLCYALKLRRPDAFHILGPLTTRLCSLEDIELFDYSQIKKRAFFEMLSREAFFYWHNTSHGLYGLEKQRIREAISTEKFVLVTFKSRGGLAFKFLMPQMTVIELRASIDTLEARIRVRNRPPYGKELMSRLESAYEELAANDLAFRYWSIRPDGYWQRIYNDGQEPPIASSVVEQAFRTIIEQHKIN
jgi:guanylate kinase